MPGTERNAEEVRTTNAASSHPTIQLPFDTNVVQSTALIPYTPVGGTNDTPCLHRPRRLTPDENFAIMSTVNQNVRRRAGCESQRAEARAIWRRLRYPTPDGPFGTTEGFGDDAIRSETLGYAYLELAGEWETLHRVNIYTPQC